MKIFLSYASEQKDHAERIAFSLRQRVHVVFLDRDDLPPGSSYDDKIEKAIDQSDLFLFLITPAAVRAGRYTLTELKFARAKWPNPNNRVLPVMIELTPIKDVPVFLQSVSFLIPEGNIAAEVAALVDRIGGPERAFRNAAFVGFCAIPLSIILLLASINLTGNITDHRTGHLWFANAGLAVFIAYLFYRYEEQSKLKVSLIFLIGFVLTLISFRLGYDVGFVIPEFYYSTDENAAEEVKKALETYSTLNNSLGWLISFVMIGVLWVLSEILALSFFSKAFRASSRWFAGSLIGVICGFASYLIFFVTKWPYLMFAPPFALMSGLITFYMVRGQPR